MSEENARRPVATRHPDTQAVIKFLRDKPVGTEVSYDEVSKVACRNLRKDRGPLDTARRALWSEGQYWLVVRSEGIVKVCASEALKSCGTDKKRVEKASRRTVRKLAQIDFDALESGDQSSWNKLYTIMQMHTILGKPKTEKAIDHAVEEKRNRLALAESLEAMKGIL